jgi:hypothetical protein
MSRLLYAAAATLVIVGSAERAAAATWRLVQPSGETVTLTVTDSVVRIATKAHRIEIPVAQVRSMRVTISQIHPEGFIYLTWLDGAVSRSISVRTGFFTPFVERRLRDAGVHGLRSTSP